VAVADLFPRFSLTGSLGLESGKFVNLVSEGSQFWSIGPSVSWPIFSAGRIRSNIRVQDARAEQAAHLYDATVLTALSETEDALIAYSKEQARRRSLAEAVDANTRALDLANQLYRQGRTDFLSVLDAQRQLFAAEDALVQSDRNVSTDLVALYTALGGGWEMELEGGAPEAQAQPVSR
jgi:outer membrane protein TolC